MSLPVDERFSAALHSTARSWRIGLDRRLKFLGLSQAGWTTIGVVAKAGKPMSQTELANAAGVEGATMVTMLDRLVRGGLVERLASTTDRRIKLISLTKAGRALYDKVHAEAGVYRRELLAGVAEADLEQAIALLERVRAKIEVPR